MGQKQLVALAVALATGFAVTHVQGAGATEAPGSSGTIRHMKGAASEFDRYSSDPAWTSWINSHFWRMRTYTPYFDAKTSGYSRAWVYRNLYGLDTGSAVARNHPEWILRDGSGNKLFVPWGCGGGTCPLYAFDFGNPQFRAWWIDEATQTMAEGYLGLWIDDVNLVFRSGDRSGNHVAPIDPRAGGTMTEAAWRRTMADFLVQIRVAVPHQEIIHNAIWYAPESDANVVRAHRTADYINIERGVNDGGLTNGGGTFGYESLLAYIDRRHGEGHAVVFDAYASTDAAREYGLASYMLTNNGADGYSNSVGTAPDDWWAGFDVSLGNASGARYHWQGLLRRDFAGGMALVNQPGAASVTVQLGGTYRDVEGHLVTSVSLGAASGTVLRTPAAPVVPQSPPTTPPAPETPTSTPATPPATTPATPTPAIPPASHAMLCRTKQCRSRVRLSLKVSKSKRAVARHHRSAALLRGFTLASAAHSLRFSLHRKASSSWRGLRHVTSNVSRSGRFRVVFANLPPGRYRVSVALSGKTVRTLRFTVPH
jgi:hypothetical protein